MNDVDAWSLISLGALTRDAQHEAHNLLAVASAWTSLEPAHEATHLKPFLAKAGDALKRLAHLHHALRLCASPRDPTPSGEPLDEIFDWAAAVTEPRRRVAGVALTTALDGGLLDVPVRPVVLSLALLLRHATEVVAAGDRRAIDVAARTKASRTPTVTLRYAASLPDFDAALPFEHASGDALWIRVAPLIARHWLASVGATLTFSPDGATVAFNAL